MKKILYAALVLWSVVCLVLIVQPVRSVHVVGTVEKVLPIGVVKMYINGDWYLPFLSGVEVRQTVTMTCNRGEWINALMDCVVEKVPERRAPEVSG
jgi:hypothetical protein